MQNLNYFYLNFIIAKCSFNKIHHGAKHHYIYNINYQHNKWSIWNIFKNIETASTIDKNAYNEIL